MTARTRRTPAAGGGGALTRSLQTIMAPGFPQSAAEANEKADSGPKAATKVSKDPKGTGVRPTGRILGLDLAMGTTGWALLVNGQPDAHGTFELPDYRRRNEPLAAFLERRAIELLRQVSLLISTHRPHVVGYEYPDSYRRSWSGGSKGREFVVMQALARAEGMLIAQWRLIADAPRLISVSTTDAKRLACGKHDANKDQVAQGLRTIWRWDLSGWTPDETDAAAVALAAREEV